MTSEISAAMKAEHDELHADLVKATKSGGETSEAAKSVARVLHGHFVGEEEFAMPPLGLLTRLARGEFDPAMADVLKMTDRLEAELPKMLSEHAAITSALDNLIAAARKEKSRRSRPSPTASDPCSDGGAGLISGVDAHRPLREADDGQSLKSRWKVMGDPVRSPTRPCASPVRCCHRRGRRRYPPGPSRSSSRYGSGSCCRPGPQSHRGSSSCR